MIKWVSEKPKLPLPEALPALRGWALRIYDAVWFALMGLSIAVAALNAWQSAQPMEYGWLNYGLSADASGEQIVLVVGPEAIAQDIRPGEAIVAIDGIPMEKIGASYNAAREALARPEGAAIRLSLRDASGKVREHRLTRNRANTRDAERTRWFEIITGVLSSIATLCAAALLFRRRRDPVPAILALAFVCQVGLSWQAIVWLNRPQIADALQFISNLNWPLLLLGLLAFPDGRMGSRAAWLIAGALGCWSVIMLVMPSLSISVPAILAFLALGMGRQWLRFRRMPLGTGRQQVRWGIFGLVAGGASLILAGLFYLAAMQIGGPAYWTLSLVSNIFGLVASLCMVGGLLISLLRYRLYDAEAAISRSIAYGALTVALLAIFAGTERVIELLGEEYLGHGFGVFAGGLAAAAAAAMISPLHHRVTHWAERRFQKHLLHLRHGLPLLVGDLRETAGLDGLASAVLDAVLKGVRARQAALLVGDKIEGAKGVAIEDVEAWRGKWQPPAGGAIDSDRHDRLFPMRVPLDAEGHGRVGWLLLGPRPDGSLFGKDEREALADIADPVARAIDVVRARAAREERQERLNAAHAERLDRLDSLVSAWLATGGTVAAD